MKKFLNSKVSKCFFYMLLVVVFYSCVPNKEAVVNYKGCIVYEMKKYSNGNCYIDLRKDSLLLNIRVHNYEYNLLQVGDTIK